MIVLFNKQKINQNKKPVKIIDRYHTIINVYNFDRFDS